MTPVLYFYSFWNVAAERQLENGLLEVRGMLVTDESVTAIFPASDAPKWSWVTQDWVLGQGRSSQELEKVLNKERVEQGEGPA